MDIPFQRVPLDSGPPAPKPGGTHAMGTDRNMRVSQSLTPDFRLLSDNLSTLLAWQISGFILLIIEKELIKR